MDIKSINFLKDQQFPQTSFEILPFSNTWEASKMKAKPPSGSKLLFGTQLNGHESIQGWWPGQADGDGLKPRKVGSATEARDSRRTLEFPEQEEEDGIMNRGGSQERGGLNKMMSSTLGGKGS